MSLGTFVEMMDSTGIHDIVNWIPSGPNEEVRSDG